MLEGIDSTLFQYLQNQPPEQDYPSIERHINNQLSPIPTDNPLRTYVEASLQTLSDLGLLQT